jgi:hypothetical protein
LRTGRRASPPGRTAGPASTNQAPTASGTSVPAYAIGSPGRSPEITACP